MANFQMPPAARHSCLMYKNKPVNAKQKEHGCIAHIDVNNFCIYIFNHDQRGEVWNISFSEKAIGYRGAFHYSLVEGEGAKMSLNQHVELIMSMISKQAVAVALDLRASFRAEGMYCND